MTLISAPAGFGKITLVSEWVNQKAEGGGMKDELFPLIHPSSLRLRSRQAFRLQMWPGSRSTKATTTPLASWPISSMHARLGMPLTQRCGAHCPYEWRPTDKGGGRCYYWRPGLLHRLFDEHLLAIEISGTRRATIQIWRTLPLLTPHQVSQLNDFLQDQHDRWLERYGHLFNISSQQWSAITLTSLLPWLPGHPDRELQGQPPQNPLQ